jgi:hypothetical protein
MVPAAEAPAAVLHDAHAPALGAVLGRQLLQPDDAVRHAVHRLVGGVGGQVVQQQDRDVLAGEVVLQRQDLPPVAERALRQQPDLRQAVDHHPLRLLGLHGLEDHPGRFAQLQVGRIEQALLLLLVQQALGRDQLEDVHPVQRPAVRGGRGHQLLLRLRQRDVEGALAQGRARQQELQRGGGLARPGASLEQIDAVARQPAPEDGVQPGHARGRQVKRARGPDVFHGQSWARA